MTPARYKKLVAASRASGRRVDHVVEVHASGFREGFASARDGIARWLRKQKKGGLAIRVDAEEFRELAGHPKPGRIDP